MGKKLEKSSNKNTKKFLKYLWKGEKAQWQQLDHLMKCTCNSCARARRPRPKKLFTFNLFSCAKGGVKFGPADAGLSEGSGHRSARRYRHKSSGHHYGDDDLSILFDKDLCTNRLQQLWPFWGASRSDRRSSHGHGSSTSSSSSCSTTSTSSNSSSSFSASSEESSDTDDDVKDIDGVLVRRRYGGRKGLPLPPPASQVASSNKRDQATTGIVPRKPAAAVPNTNPPVMPSSGSRATTSPVATSRNPNQQQPRRSRKKVRFSPQFLPSPPVKKVPRDTRKKPAGSLRGILQSPTKANQQRQQQTPRQRQTPVAPASKALWRHAESQRRRRCDGAYTEADAAVMSSAMPPHAYSGGALYYYWGAPPLHCC